MRKTIDTWEVQGEYGNGWQTEAVALTLADAVEMQRQYRKSYPYPVRVKKVRQHKSKLEPEAAKRLEAAQKARQQINDETREKKRRETFREDL